MQFPADTHETALSVACGVDDWTPFANVADCALAHVPLVDVIAIGTKRLFVFLN